MAIRHLTCKRLNAGGAQPPAGKQGGLEMTDITKQSLGELKELYIRKIKYWSQQKLKHEEKIEQCRREIQACEAKLSHVEALVGSPAAPKASAAKTSRRRTKKRRIRQSPVKMATLLALRNRPGELLTTKQLLTAIRKDTGKRVSRQSITVNLGLLEKEGRIGKQPAPRGSGARFVYSVVPGA